MIRQTGTHKHTQVVWFSEISKQKQNFTRLIIINLSSITASLVIKMQTLIRLENTVGWTAYSILGKAG
jgi:hypothetical protein